MLLGSTLAASSCARIPLELVHACTTVSHPFKPCRCLNLLPAMLTLILLVVLLLTQACWWQLLLLALQ
jgi:hypothetical protein